uniref:HLF transcription factor, PAR bZIP family member n=1 Tax=Sander lucioperca TaxID=283035 RepID=A0A8D0D0Y5_SANLU
MNIYLILCAGFGAGQEKDLEEERSAPQSAFLGPTLWDKTLSYNGDTLQLEYMDLEEFLSENGIPSVPSNHQPRALPSSGSTPSSSRMTELLTLSLRETPATLLRKPISAACTLDLVLSGYHTSQPPRNTPSPIDPDTIQVPVRYEPDPADLVLSSVPGQEMFDPRKCKFSSEELKPQPMIKKARKVFIPEDLKDDKYWARRRKNNLAAKRSRDARRLKENQIAIRAGFLEKENSALRQEVAELRKELGRTKNVLAKYEARHGLL